jgi:hypothetical protein
MSTDCEEERNESLAGDALIQINSMAITGFPLTSLMGNANDELKWKAPITIPDKTPMPNLHCNGTAKSCMLILKGNCMKAC